MNLARSSLDARRRRLLAPDSAADADDASSNSVELGQESDETAARETAPRPARLYPAAMTQSSPRVTDLVPRQPLTFVLLALAGALAIAGLEGLYAWMPSLASHTSDGRIAAFDLDGEGSLSAWFSATLLLAASLGSLVMYSIRKHKTDDFAGRYRVWLWASAWWLVMSADESGSLHEGFKELMSQATGTRIHGDGSIWWIAPYGLVLGVLGWRLWVDLRGSLAARIGLFLTYACWALAIALQAGLLMREAGAKEVMVEEGLEMLGYLTLTLTTLAAARRELRVASGEAPGATTATSGGWLRRRKQAKAKVAAQLAATHSKPNGRREAAPGSPASPAATPTAQPVLRSADLRVDASHGAGPHSGPKLSKAERKRLRRMQRTGSGDEDEGEE